MSKAYYFVVKKWEAAAQGSTIGICAPVGARNKNASVASEKFEEV